MRTRHSLPAALTVPPSDLAVASALALLEKVATCTKRPPVVADFAADGAAVGLGGAEAVGGAFAPSTMKRSSPGLVRAGPRSEERRVGEEGVRTCSSRWSPDH